MTTGPVTTGPVTSGPVTSGPVTSGPAAAEVRPPRVVVGVDGSPGARTALRAALVEAARRGAGLDVVAAYPEVLVWTGGFPVQVPDIGALRAATRDRARAFLDDVRAEPAAADVPDVGRVPVHLVVAGGRPSAILVDRARGADLLVVGSRGRGLLRSALLGSVALHCVTHAPCPVRVVPDTPAAHEGGGGTVVVGFDGSPAAVTALREALGQAARLGADVDVVVAHSLADLWADLYAVGVDEEQIRTRVQRDAQGTVERMVAAATAAGQAVPAVHVELVQGFAQTVLLERAAGAAALVVGSRGHGPVSGLLLGSVALHCVVSAPCPVTVVHPEDRTTPAPPAEQPVAASG